MEKIIDCKGMACPLPVVNAKKASEELCFDLQPSDILTVSGEPETDSPFSSKRTVAERPSAYAHTTSSSFGPTALGIMPQASPENASIPLASFVEKR